MNTVPLGQPVGSAVRDEFYLKLTGKSAAQLKAFWSKVIFTGNPAAIGYLERERVDPTVRNLG